MLLCYMSCLFFLWNARILYCFLACLTKFPCPAHVYWLLRQITMFSFLFPPQVLSPTYKQRNEDFRKLFKKLPDTERLIVGELTIKDV